AAAPATISLRVRGGEGAATDFTLAAALASALAAFASALASAFAALASAFVVGAAAAAACAARRAAAMKFGFSAGSAMTGGLAEPAAASDAAMRSAADAGLERPLADPGSSG